MYEKMKVHKGFSAGEAVRALHLDTKNSKMHPLADDATILLNKAENHEVSCAVQIASVSVVVDLLPDANSTWIGNVAGAKWLGGSVPDMQMVERSQMLQAITDAGAVP
jgi:hypothetical protein